MKELVRIVGISLILSGTILYFTNTPKSDATLQQENATLHNQVTDLQTKLEQTEEELAHLQTLTSKLEEGPKDSEPAPEKNTAQKQTNAKETVPKDTIEKDEAGVTKLTLTIESGTTSQDVASTLEKANIIKDAQDFNDYLKEKGLTTSIQIGKHAIDGSMSIETISKIITTLPKE